jgi:hypothetical protein
LAELKAFELGAEPAIDELSALYPLPLDAPVPLLFQLVEPAYGVAVLDVP